LLAKLCGKLGTSWDAAFPYDRDACVKYIEYGAREYLLDGGMNNKSNIDQTFEVMSRMNLKPGIDFAFENNREFLCIIDRYGQYA